MWMPAGWELVREARRGSGASASGVIRVAVLHPKP